MDLQHIKEIIVICLNRLYSEDEYLLDKGVHERTIFGRLACYISNRFSNDYPESGYSIDCEYNQYNGTPKECSGLGKCIPDLLIHKRGVDIEYLRDPSIFNLLYCEGKTYKSKGCKIGGTKKNQKECIKYDKKKIKCFMEDSNYLYKFGLFIYFGKDYATFSFFKKNINGIAKASKKVNLYFNHL